MFVKHHYRSFVTFVTGNKNKLNEVKLILSLPNLISRDLPLVETQGSPIEVALAKAIQAQSLVEGNSNCIDELL